MDTLISAAMMLLPGSPSMDMAGGYAISKRKQHQDELWIPHKDWIFIFMGTNLTHNFYTPSKHFYLMSGSCKYLKTVAKIALK